jgi:hypothetical protein
MTDLERAIRQLVSDYVAGQMPLSDFDGGLALATWDLPANDPGARRLGHDVDLLVAEHTSGHRTEPDLRAELVRTLGDVLDVRLPARSRAFILVRGIGGARTRSIVRQGELREGQRSPIPQSPGLASNVVLREAVSA